MSASPWIKFCEPTYVRTESIAEFWNTLSSFAYFVVGLIFLFKINRFRSTFPECYSRGVVWRYRLSAVAWIFLGLGSAAFHAYQTIPTELWDELGMLLVSFTISFGLFDLHPLTTSRKANWFYGALTLFVITTILIYVQIMYHPFFALMFAISAIVPLAITLTLPMKLNNGQVKYYKEAETSPKSASGRKMYLAKANQLSITGMINMTADVYYAAISIVAGYVIWNIDQKCVREDWRPHDVSLYEFDWYYWCHPAWHTLTAIGAMFICDAMLKVRIESFLSPLLRKDGTGSFIPQISFGSSVKLLFYMSPAKKTS